MSWPVICVRTVTVASGVTVPSALSVTGMSPFCAVATTTGIGPLPLNRPRGAGAVCGRSTSQAIPPAASATKRNRMSHVQAELRTGFGMESARRIRGRASPVR